MLLQRDSINIPSLVTLLSLLLLLLLVMYWTVVLLLLLHPSYFDLRPSFFDFSLHARLRLLARWKRLGNVGSLGWRGATLVFLRTSTDNISFFDISIMDRVDACVSISSEYGCVTSCGIGWVDGWCTWALLLADMGYPAIVVIDELIDTFAWLPCWFPSHHPCKSKSRAVRRNAIFALNSFYLTTEQLRGKLD